MKESEFPLRQRNVSTPDPHIAIDLVSAHQDKVIVRALFQHDVETKVIEVLPVLLPGIAVPAGSEAEGRHLLVGSGGAERPPRSAGEFFPFQRGEGFPHVDCAGHIVKGGVHRELLELEEAGEVPALRDPGEGGLVVRAAGGGHPEIDLVFSPGGIAPQQHHLRIPVRGVGATSQDRTEGQLLELHFSP